MGMCPHTCVCKCHVGDPVKHNSPCCVKCKICGRSIMMGMIEKHVIDCHYHEDYGYEDARLGIGE